MTESQSSRVQLHALGRVSVTRIDGDATAPLLTQPRRLAVLAYLLLARPRGLHSRDTLVALLWPEADQAGGRHALRNALHGIRQALGEVIVTAGDEQVGVNRDRISCDAISLEVDLAAGRLEEAVTRYTGELLQGFHVGEAPEFEHWLDGERSHLHDSVLRAAIASAERCRARGDVEGALSAARRASALAPDDEVSLRRLIEILNVAGDRAGALREYDRFAARAQKDYGVHPSAETLELVRKLRAPSTSESLPRNRATSPRSVEAGDLAPERTAAASVAAPASSSPAEDTIGRRRRRVVAGAVLALAVMMLIVIGLRSGPLAQASGMRSSIPSTHNPVIGPASRLPERYRTDTALLRRYLAAEADLEFLRLKGARQSFQRLADESPLYAPAWAGLSFTLFQSAFNDMPPSDALPRSVAAANRALALDSTLVEAQSTLIANAMFGQWDLQDAKRRLDAALAHYPNDPELNNLLATWHRWRGEVDAALRLKQHALAIDPLSPRFANQVGSSLYFAHRCGEAAEAFVRIAEERRAPVRVRLILYRSLKCDRRMDEAAVALRESLLETGDTTLSKLLNPPLPPARRDSAIHAVFRARLNRYYSERTQRWRSSTEAMVSFAELGQRDSTLVWLDSMYVERAMMLHVVPFDPLMDFLRGDPRFQ
ncbi:MAG: transcriptional activator protein, partial [Gemmatimonadales bacterium]|nr:transcriptional activator protein [Gemmatimonadales bacterium]